MLTKLFTSTVALLFLATVAVAQTGSIVRVDTDKKQLEVKVGDTTHTVAAADVTLLDKDGKTATLADFGKGDAVEVTIEEGAITEIERTDGAMFAAPAEGKVVAVDTDKKSIEIKVGDKTHTLAAADVALLDKDGKTATLADFAADDAVEVTMAEGVVTEIRKKD